MGGGLPGEAFFFCPQKPVVASVGLNIAITDYKLPHVVASMGLNIAITDYSPLRSRFGSSTVRTIGDSVTYGSHAGRQGS